MLWLLFTFALCELKISDVNVRLPIYCDKEGTNPYQIITIFSPDADLIPQSEDLIDVEYMSRDSTSTVAKIIVKYSDPQPIATEVIAKSGMDSTKITVNIDRIDQLQILSTADSLYVNRIIPIKVNAYNEKGLIFSSLNGTELEWGSIDTTDRPFDFYDIEATPLNGRGDIDPSHYRIIRPKRVAITNITCKLIKRDAHMANQRFRFVDPIIFQPDEIYMLKTAETDLHLYYAVVNTTDDQIHPNLDRIINLSTEYNLFTVKSYSPLIATVSQSGRVLALELGKTTITARDKSLLSNIANAIVHVIIPNGARWEEQWIKSQDQNTGPDAIGPFEPDTSTIVLLSDNHSVVTPENLRIELSDEWKEVGTHAVTVSFPDVGYDFLGTVHTCPPPRVDPPQVRLPVGYNNYQFKIYGGSGDYDFDYDNSLLLVDNDTQPQIIELENGTFLSIHSLSPLKEGTAVITIYDKKFKDYVTTLTIVTATPYSIDLEVNDSELFVGEKFTNYTAYVYDKDHNLFDNIQAVDIKPENLTILNESLLGTTPGFTNIHGSIGNLVSNTKRILVMDRLTVSSPLNGTSMMTYNLNRTGGPIRWGGAGQSNTITCGGAKFEFIDNHTFIKFLADYEGECTLQVVNERTEENPNPRVVETNFSVILAKLCYVAILATDSDSLNIPECNLLMSQIIDNNNAIISDDETEPLERVDIARIPYDHHLELNLFAFGENDKRLGIYSEPNAEITITDINNTTTPYYGSFQVKDNMNITVHVNDDLTIVPLHVEVIHPHRTREPNPFSLYKKNKKGAEAHIIHGNGPFNIVTGEDIEFIDDRTLHINASFKSVRSANISDQCIPENYYVIDIKTFSIGSIEIIGPTQAVVGERLQFEAHLITPDGTILPSEFNDQVKWSNETDGIEYNNETGLWEITAQDPGRLEIILIADDNRRTHTVTVFEEIVPISDNLTMFVGERLPLEFKGGLGKDKIQVNSSDPEIVSIEPNLVAVAHRPGVVQATAYFSNYSGVGNAIITIYVLEAKNLILECNSTNLETGDPVYVGSYVHVVPHIETNMGPRPPKTIKWNIDGSDNYYELYDHSIIIRGDKEGTVVVTASSINNLANETNIYFDYKLQLSNQDHIKIPIGGTYHLKPVDENMQNVTYHIAPYSCQDVINGVTINETGQIFAGAEGRYLVIANYKNQWQAVPLTITKPTKLFLQSEAAQIVRPRVLDPDYQEYTPFDRSNVTFNTTFEYVNYDGHYTFDVPPDNHEEPVLVDSKVSVYPRTILHPELELPPLWSVSHSALLFPRKLIYPQNPTVQKGTQLQFKCQASKPDFVSVNPRVATISPSGLLDARMEGRTVIKCTPDIETTVTVVTFESVSLRKVNDKIYKIEEHFIPQNIENKNLTLSSDNSYNISYSCNWDAEECGHTRYEYNATTGERFCKLYLHDKHLCPEHSILTVTVDSPKTGINLVGRTDVNLKNTYFLITSIVDVGIAPGQEFMEFDLNQNSSFSNNFTYEVPPKVNLTYDETNKKVTLQFFEGFKGGDVIFEHKEVPRERVKLRLKLDKSYWSSSYLKPNSQKWDNPIFIISIIITLLMVVYVLASLGEGELLPPYSPYQVKTKKSSNRRKRD